MRKALLSFAVAVTLPFQAAAQDQTLADIRQQLTALYVQVQQLNTELSTTGSAMGGASVGGSALERLNAIQTELQRLTSKTEELEFQITQVVRDGTNRIGDLEFRLCELEPNCDIGSLGDTPSLGGVDTGSAAIPTPVTPTVVGPQLAVGEQADFDAAKTAMESGDFRTAVSGFDNFVMAYPGSPLAQEAHYLSGEAYESLGEVTNAARAYLGSFSADPAGAIAPDALFKLGFSLGALGQTQDACTTLMQVGVRFPNTDAALDAQSAMRNFGCS
ncbi:tol-pal system protein YbgF [Marivivens niveibacter]|uniref:Cell division coordinator CpoB n=1 Tax=Marivivens niveibacter TaxID=1930667 RepID=A0A251WXM4_9RHOB|nr:tol-pal system protein YbgF [Marivivens niveibacter]OUD09239.1 tol-pal system protein YbgF [Marivivens niveibacter]